MSRARHPSNLRSLIVMALSVALAGVGAFIKIPSPVGTVAMDSWPGYACSIIIGRAGAWVAFAGHVASAFISGFPLGTALHLAVALEMALCAHAFALVTRRIGIVAGAAVAILLNGVVAPLALSPWLGLPLAVSLIAPLSAAAVANVAAATAVAEAVRRIPAIGRRFFDDGRQA